MSRAPASNVNTESRAGGSWLGRFLGFVAIVVLTYLGIRYLAYDRLDEEIRSRLEAKFRNHYHGLTVSVRSARRVPGRGIEVHGLMIASADYKPGDTPWLHIDELLAECETDLTHFLTHPPEIKRFVVHQVNINAERFESGYWNLRHLFPVPSSGGRVPPVTIVGGQIRIVDHSHADDSTSKSRPPLVLRDLRLDLSENPRLAKAVGLPEDLLDAKGNPLRPPLQVRGIVSGDHIQKAEISGAFDPRRGVFHIKGNIDGLEISPRLHDGLPRDIADELAALPDVRGRVSCDWRVHNVVAEGQPIVFNVTGEVVEGRVKLPKLRYPIVDIAAQFVATEKGLQVDKVSARFGSAEFKAGFASEGYSHQSPMRIDLHTDGLRWSEEMAEMLPKPARDMWERFRPVGSFSGDFGLVFDGETWQPRCKAKATDLSFTYREFDYRLDQGEADIELQDDALTISGQAFTNGIPITFTGVAHHPGKDWHGWGELHADEPVPIDERLIAAFKPQSREVIRRFEPRGHARLDARIERTESGKLKTDYDVELVDCSIRYQHFRYPVDQVNGKFRVIDNVWTIDKLTGLNDSAQIECRGRFGPTKQPAAQPSDNLLELDFTVTNLAFEDELQRALSPSGQQLWKDVDPRGRIDLMRTKLRWRPGEPEVALDVDAYKTTPRSATDPDPIHVKPTWFPYSMAIHRGQVHYSRGVLTFSDVEASHMRTSIGIEGACTFNGDEGWTVQLNKVAATQLQIDHDLLAALPADIQRPMSQANLFGKVGVDGSAAIKRLGATEGPIDAQWDLHFDIQDGHVQTAESVPVSHIQGGIHLIGAAAHGRWQAQGDVAIDSMIVKDTQLTEVRGPIHVDADRLLIGKEADRDQPSGQPRSVTAQVFEGTALLDGEVSLREDSHFQLGISLEEASLATIAREFSPAETELSGRVFSRLKVTGTTNKKHTWRGSGKMNLRDADLYQVPAMLAVLKILSTRQTNTSAFNACDIDFRVTGDDVYFDRIHIAGDVLSLKGYGQLLMEQRTVDISLYTQVGRDDLRSTILRPFGDSGTSILLIEMKGRLDKPEVKKTAFPAINETLARLFPELDKQAKADAANSGPPPAPPEPPREPRIGSGQLWKRTQGMFRR